MELNKEYRLESQEMQNDQFVKALRAFADVARSIFDEVDVFVHSLGGSNNDDWKNGRG